MRTVCFDIDTQIDFLLPAGALYVPGAEQIIPAIGKLNRWAASQRWPLISTTCAHAEDDPEFRDWPPHCVAGTVGQLKPAQTLLDKRAVIPNAPCDFDTEAAEQILLEKQQLNLFTNQNLKLILERLDAERYLVYGVVTEYCVEMAALELLKTGKPVSVVTDAVRGLKPADADRTLRDFVAGGGTLTTVTEICSQ